MLKLSVLVEEVSLSLRVMGMVGRHGSCRRSICDSRASAEVIGSQVAPWLMHQIR